MVLRSIRMNEVISSIREAMGTCQESSVRVPFLKNYLDSVDESMAGTVRTVNKKPQQDVFVIEGDSPHNLE